jgi:hypothetical protein
MSGRSGVADGVLSPVVFVTANAFFGLETAIVAAVAVALLIVVARLVTGRPLQYALSGLFGTGIAIALTSRSGRPETYFLPGIIGGALTTVALLASISVRRPLVAYASWATRGWPLGWYWHDRIRPAYTVVAWIWVIFFGARATAQGWLYAAGEVTSLGVVRVATGWPGLLGLLVVSYVVGRRRLELLQGPSVEEYEAQKPPPWSGQTHGF